MQDKISEIEVDFAETVYQDSEEYIDEPMQEPFDPSLINIIPKPDSLRNLIERIKHNEIALDTEFQRHADLWDTQKMSRLIESVLIRFPLPAFYFDATNDNNWLIVDGLQRLSAIKRFVIDKKLKLRGLEYLKQFSGKTFEELPRSYQRRIDECPVTLFLIQPGTPDAVKYSIFRRINTGGLVLTDQEIRNAMMNPDLRIYLAELAKDEYLRKTVGDQTRRMVDQELVLRFLSFNFLNYELTTKNIASFLDDMIDHLQKSNQKERIKYKAAFNTAMKRSWIIFGDAAFEKRTADGDTRKKRKNSTLFEVWTTSLAGISEDEMTVLEQKKEILTQRHQQALAEDQDYFRSITYSTQKKEHFRIRRKKVNEMIQEILNA